MTNTEKPPEPKPEPTEKPEGFDYWPKVTTRPGGRWR